MGLFDYSIAQLPGPEFRIFAVFGADEQFGIFIKLLRIFAPMLLIAATTLAAAEPDNESWQVAVARTNTGEVSKIIRYQPETPAWLKQSSFPALVVISWPLSNPKGMPTKGESALHATFEDKLQSAEENVKSGFLAGVATGEGKVEWFYYAKSHNEFMNVLNMALRGQPRFPVAISLEQDPDWSMHKLFKRAK